MVRREAPQQAGARPAREVVLLLPEVTGWVVEAPVRAERVERRDVLVVEERSRARVQAAGASWPVCVSAKTWMAGLSGRRTAASGCSRGTGTRSRQIAGPIGAWTCRG